MATEQLALEYVARTQQLRAELERIPGMSKKATSQIVADFRRDWKAAEKQATGALGQVAQEASKLQRIGGLIGGPFGAAMQLVADGAESAEEGLSGTAKAAVALGAAGAAVAAVAAAVGNVVTNLDEYRGTLDSLQGRGIVSAAESRALEEVSAAVRVITAQVSEWAVVVAARLAPALRRTLLGASYAITYLGTLGGEVFGDLAKVASAAWDMITTGSETARSRYRVAVQDMIDMSGELAIAEATAEQAARGWLEDVAVERVRALDAWRRSSRETHREVADVQVEEAERAADGVTAALARIQEGNAGVVQAAVDNAALASRAVGEVYDSSAAQAANAARSTTASWQQSMGAIQSIAGAAMGAVSAIVTAATTAQVSQHREGTEAYRREMRKQWKAQKALGIAEIAVNTAVGAMGALAQFPGPVGIALAAIITAMGVAQGVTVGMQQPTFDVGGMIRAARAPDHVQIVAQAGEAVLSRRGVEAVGGEAGVAAANRGRAPDGGVGAVIVALSGRVVDAMATGVRASGRDGLMRRLRREAQGITGRRLAPMGG